MSSVRTLYHLARADVLERTRRYSFLVTVAATIYLGYLVADGTIGMHLGKYRGVMNAPWIGTMMTLCACTFVSLCGFYVVKNAVERDRHAGVGQILAATPVSKVLYLAAKTLSNFVVLGAVIGLLALAAVLLLLFKREQGPLDLGALLLPFLMIALPAMMVTAAVAVFFESMPGLRGGFGHVAYFFLWTALLTLPIATGSLWTDVTGVKLSMDGMQADVRTLAPDYDGHFTLGVDRMDRSKAIPVRWNGMVWTPERIGYRLLPVGWAFVLVLLAACGFDRFAAAARAPASERRLRGWSRRWGAAALKPLEAALDLAAKLLAGSIRGRMLAAELRLMIHGLPWWWHLAAAALWILSLVLDRELVRAQILPWLWIWPLFSWSPMGTREFQYGTEPLLFSSPRPLARQLPAIWTAGALVAFAAVSGLLLRGVIAGDIATAVATMSGVCFIPSLALALGVWSGGTKAFEALYLALWYLGPMHHEPALDFMATTPAAIAAGSPLVFFLLAVALTTAAFAGRRRQLARR